MFFTSERIPFVDYIASPTPTSSKFVFQQPKLSYENNLFLLSFRNSVWYSIIGLIFLVFIVLFTVTTWEWKSMDIKSEVNHHFHNFNYYLCISYILNKCLTTISTIFHLVGRVRPSNSGLMSCITKSISLN